MSSTVEMAKNLKRVHPNYILLFKIGTFYHAYGKDSYILSDLLGYKLKDVDDVSCCGFPKDSVNKIQARLEKEKINYILLDPRNNYDVDQKMDFKNDNNYDEQFKKSYEHIKARQKIKEISERISLFIDKPDFKDRIRKIEDVLDEN